jgi:hypothetical protein
MLEPNQQIIKLANNIRLHISATGKIRHGRRFRHFEFAFHFPLHPFSNIWIFYLQELLLIKIYINVCIREKGV